MKKGICTRCNNNRILVFDKFVKTKWDRADIPDPNDPDGFSFGGDDIYLQGMTCSSCGYTELYLPDPDPETIKLKEGFRELRGAPQEGVFR